MTSLSLFTFMHWRRKWQPTPAFLPGESQGRRSLVGCRLWGRTESDTTEAISSSSKIAKLYFLLRRHVQHGSVGLEFFRQVYSGTQSSPLSYMVFGSMWQRREAWHLLPILQYFGQEVTCTASAHSLFTETVIWPCQTSG